MDDKKCNICQKLKSKELFWNNKKEQDGKDFICISCREVARKNYEETPFGLFSIKSRLLVQIFKKDYFPQYSRLYHLDHKFSLKNCWDNNISLEIANHKNNLQIITKAQNLKKGSSNSITKEKLLDLCSEPDLKMIDMITLIKRIEGTKDERERIKKWTIIASQRN